MSLKNENVIQNHPEYYKEVVGPDEKGVKTVTEIYLNEKNQRIRKVTKYLVTTRTDRIKRSVLERRKWAKFGDSEGDPSGPQPATTFVSNDDIKLNLSLKGDSESVENKEGLFGISIDRKAISCRNCGEEGHWTAKCPNPRKERDDKKSSKSVVKTNPGKYVPPNLREGGSKFSPKEEFTVRISNLPEDMTREDLNEILAYFGRTERVHLVSDHETGLSRGTAFVSFYHKEDGDHLIEELNGYLYASMVLSASWAKPRDKQ